MQNFNEPRSFLEEIDSIQYRFIESLITGKRDPIFRVNEEQDEPETEEGRNQALIDSQRGTF